MKYPLVIISLLLFISVLFISCADEPSSIGVELVGGDNIVVKTFDSQTDTINQTTSYFKRVIPLSSASKILIGKNQDVTAYALMQFLFALPDTIKDAINDNSISVTDSWLILRRRYTFGDTLANMNFTVHKITTPWTINTFTIDSLSILQYEQNDVSSNLMINDTTYTFDLDTGLVLSWMKYFADPTQESNYGIFYMPDASSQKVVGFQALSLTTTGDAKLYVVLEKPGSYVDTINGFVASDVSLIDGMLPTAPPGELAVRSSITVNGLLKFDLSKIPAGAVINSATLTIYPDTTNSLYGTDYNNSLIVFFEEDPDSNKYLTPGVTLNQSGSGYTGTITQFVRAWIYGTENNGLLIQPGNQVEGLELFMLYGSDAADFNLRPRLKIVYTTKENL